MSRTPFIIGSTIAWQCRQIVAMTDSGTSIAGVGCAFDMETCVKDAAHKIIE